MYLWDANILRYFGQGHPTLRLHILRVSWREMALPSVVVAEVLRGRSDFALKASPVQAPQAHERLQETIRMLSQFHIVVFDQERVGPGPIHTRNDLPAGAARLFAEAEGIEHVLVNGTEIVRGKALTGASPGTVLRSGRDTETHHI